MAELNNRCEWKLTRGHVDLRRQQHLLWAAGFSVDWGGGGAADSPRPRAAPIGGAACHSRRLLLGGLRWLAARVCVCSQRSLCVWTRRAPEGIISMDHLSRCGRPHNKEGPRMVLVHVGYLVLPVFGSVRNRGMTSFSISRPNPVKRRRVSSSLSKCPPDVNRADTC